MQLKIFKDSTELSKAAAEWIVSLIQKKLATGDRFCLLLSGGNTPKQLYHLLASDQYRNRIDWKGVHIFFGDERVVPFKDERNNGKMAFDSLLSKVPIPKEQVHYIDTSQQPEVAADNYMKLLHEYFDGEDTTFDLALLGMGDDGHTLSIFPGTEAVNEKVKWVISIYLQSQKMHRITLTPVVVNKSAAIAFLVTGAAKAQVLKRVLEETSKPPAYPVQLIHPLSGELHWFADEGAIAVI